MLFLCLPCTTVNAPSSDFAHVSIISDHSASCDLCGLKRSRAYAYERIFLT